jgi:acetyl/propionyl-CoA carboxylase alpha subunit/acetyl-CoA carboxylase carboxyltransferase component
LIQGVREFNSERGTAIRTLALYTDLDREARFVREADEAVYLGPSSFVDERDGRRKSGYFDFDRMGRVLAKAEVDAAWVGWGYVVPHVEFAELCATMGILFIGPSPSVVRLFDDKIAVRKLAEERGIAVLPWSGGAVERLHDAQKQAEAIGYPLVIKAANGGGGRGLRVVQNASELATAFERTRVDARTIFGNPSVLMERHLACACQVDVQVAGDSSGTVWALGVRDASVQRRQRRTVDESPSPLLSVEEDRLLRQVAVSLLSGQGYEGVGTVEFLMDRKTRAFTLLEVNPRLLIEHGVIEATTGFDIVKLQLLLARGGCLEGDAPLASGHAIEVRLRAEDPHQAFAPSPGAVEAFRAPTGPGIRVDVAVGEGELVHTDFDTLVAKVIASGRSRGEALARLEGALRDTTLVLAGGASNKSFLLSLVQRAELRSGEAHVDWVDGLEAADQVVPDAHADIALAAAAIELHDEQLAAEERDFFVAASRGRPRVRSELGRSVEVHNHGHTYRLLVAQRGADRYRIEAEGRILDTSVLRHGRFERRLQTPHHGYRAVVVHQGSSHLVEVDGIAHRFFFGVGASVLAPSPAVVQSIAVKEGDSVERGQRLMVLEAMKMAIEIVAPFAGRIREVSVVSNVPVPSGATLVIIDGKTHHPDEHSAARITFESWASSGDAAPGETARERWRRTVTELRSLMLGFEVSMADARRLVGEVAKLQKELPADDDEVRRSEDELLGLFVDICSLFRRRPGAEDPEEEEDFSAEEFLLTYLRTCDPRAAGLPGSFLEELRRAVAHYGVSGFERTAKLEDALFWIYKSHQQIEDQVPAIVQILEHRLAQVDRLLPHVTEDFSALLDRLARATGSRYPLVHDLAREVGYRYFDRPMFERARAKIYEEAHGRLDKLARDPDAADRREHMQWLLECPQPLVDLLADRFESARLAKRQLMLEVLSARHYRIRDIRHFLPMTLGHRAVVAAEYTLDGRRVQLLSTYTTYADVGHTGQLLCQRIAELSDDVDIVVDLFVWRVEAPVSADELQSALAKTFGNVGFPRPLRRICTMVSGPGGGHTQHFTFRPTPDGGYAEERAYRGLHPMMGKRLQLWQLGNFNIERLPSAEDVYLFRAVAKSNPKDERLVAFGEVRDLTAVRDKTGKLVQLPHFERLFQEAIASMRMFQSHRPPGKRLYWNRIDLYVWPSLSLRRDEIHEVARKLAPATEGLGLDKAVLRVRVVDPANGLEPKDTEIQIAKRSGLGLSLTYHTPSGELIEPLSEYDQKVVRMRQRGLTYPYEIVRMLTPSRSGTDAEYPPGEFVEYDLASPKDIALVPVQRPYGNNTANIVVGVLRNYTEKVPEGIARVVLAGDPSKSLGSLAEPECRRILGALALAATMQIPIEWFALSSGARISMQSGTENMDWIADVLRGLIEFTQKGGEINIVVMGINVGGQPYWNAEATMLMHTRGILIMMPGGAMVLTGKRALDYSGGVSAEDDVGIGGYERIMGVNGQAQYLARDAADACHILLRHYEHTYVVPGERFPRRAPTQDRPERDVGEHPHGEGFAKVGDIFSDVTNPGRKKPFNIRKVMGATIDQDHEPLERWVDMRDAENAVVWDAHLGGYPVMVLGIESQPVERKGVAPADGPEHWTGGTLFPKASKKVARAINTASGNRPIVILANLSGFDGSPESLRECQLEFGAEIGRAVVNFRGPIVFCVISRFHGGAYVVFSRTLNDNIEVAALEGTFASVIGGAPAAGVVFAGEVEARARGDARIKGLEAEIAQAPDLEKRRIRAKLETTLKVVRAEKVGELADEFDKEHSVHRALRVGSLHRIIPPSTLRPYLIDAVERGMARELERVRTAAQT